MPRTKLDLSKAPGPTPAQIAAHNRRNATISRAHADPLPGPLLDVLLPPQISALGFTLREPVASDLAILKAIASPLFTELTEMGKPADQRTPVAYADEQFWELFYLWTRPVPEARAALAKGAPAFRATALAATSDAIPFSAVAHAPQIMQAMQAKFIAQFAASVGYGPPAKEGESFPKAPGRPTDSAGG